MTLLGCLCFLALFSFSSAAVGECDASSLGYTCMKELAEYYHLHWTLQGELVHMALEGFGAEWVGFAFPEKAGEMAPADATIGWVDINGPSVLPYRLTAKSVYAEDEDFAIVLSNVTAFQDPERTIVQFTRSIRQGRVRVRPDRFIDINFAIGDTDSLRYHRMRGSGQVHLAADPGDGRTTAFIPQLLTTESEETSESPEAPSPNTASPPEAASAESSLPSAPPPTVTAEAPAVPCEEAIALIDREEEDEVSEMLDELN